MEWFMAKVGSKLLSWLIVAGIIGVLSTTIYIMHLQSGKKDLEIAALNKDLSLVVDANKTNETTIRQLHREAELANQITAKEIAKGEQTARSLAEIKRKLKNAEGSQEPMGSLFDDLADQLRALDKPSTDSN